jgi:hypothetical protein
MKKSTKKAKKQLEGPTLIDRLPKNHGEWLELCVKFTDRAISNPPRESEKWLVDQSFRLEKQIDAWRKNEGKN